MCKKREKREKEKKRNPNRGEAEDMEFPGVLKKYQVEILGVNSKRSAISRGDQRV